VNRAQRIALAVHWRRRRDRDLRAWRCSCGRRTPTFTIAQPFGINPDQQPVHSTLFHQTWPGRRALEG
jgi:hypothetical protein